MRYARVAVGVLMLAAVATAAKYLLLTGTPLDPTVTTSTGWIVSSAGPMAIRFFLDQKCRVDQVAVTLTLDSGPGNFRVQLTDGLGTGHVFADQTFSSSGVVTLTLPKPINLPEGGYYIVASSTDSELTWLRSSGEIATPYGHADAPGVFTTYNGQWINLLEPGNTPLQYQVIGK